MRRALSAGAYNKIKANILYDINSLSNPGEILLQHKCETEKGRGGGEGGQLVIFFKNVKTTCREYTILNSG